MDNLPLWQNVRKRSTAGITELQFNLQRSICDNTRRTCLSASYSPGQSLPKESFGRLLRSCRKHWLLTVAISTPFITCLLFPGNFLKERSEERRVGKKCSTTWL